MIQKNFNIGKRAINILPEGYLDRCQEESSFQISISYQKTYRRIPQKSKKSRYSRKKKIDVQFFLLIPIPTFFEHSRHRKHSPTILCAVWTCLVIRLSPWHQVLINESGRSDASYFQFSSLKTSYMKSIGEMVGLQVWWSLYHCISEWRRPFTKLALGPVWTIKRVDS